MFFDPGSVLHFLLLLHDKLVYLLLKTDFLSLSGKVLAALIVDKMLEVVKLASNLVTDLGYISPCVRNFVKLVKLRHVYPSKLS